MTGLGVKCGEEKKKAEGRHLETTLYKAGL
jgi:hypothetical protein